MDLRKNILTEHSRANCDNIVDWVGNNKKRFDELLNLFYEGQYRLTQRAAWPISVCVEKNPALADGKISFLIKQLDKEGQHVAVKRNILRIVNSVLIPKELEGDVMQRCFDYLNSNDEPVAVKAFSLHILYTLSRKYPEIIPEINMLISDQLIHQTAAFRSAGEKFLN